MPLLALTGQELDGVKLEAELFFPARIKQALTNWRVGAPMTINDREVQVVQGTTAGGATATMCFDSASGLLVRLVRFSESPVGRIVTQVDLRIFATSLTSSFRFTDRQLAEWTLDLRTDRRAAERDDRRGEVRAAGTRKALTPTRSA